MASNRAYSITETLISLELYLNVRPNVTKKVSNPYYHEYGKILTNYNRLKRRTLVRTAGAMRMGCSNFRALDPTDNHDGLGHYTPIQKEIWRKYNRNLKKVRSIVGKLIVAIQANDLDTIMDIELKFNLDPIPAKEYKRLKTQHNLIETVRNRKIVQDKKADFYSKHGKLYCEICEFDFKQTYGVLGTYFIECHHLTPLYKLKKGEVRITKLDDLALLCANCHRMIHKNLNELTISKMKALL
jgi:5-methylcytosine-specific restriction protein A